MERIKFVYGRNDDFKEDVEDIDICMQMIDKNGEGLHDDDVCSMFIQFMNACGFSQENILKYFSE